MSDSRITGVSSNQWLWAAQPDENWIAEDRSNLAFENGDDLIALVNRCPMEFRRPVDYNPLLGAGLREDSSFLLRYLKSFPNDQKNPIYFDHLIGDGLRMNPLFWVQWLSVFPDQIIYDGDCFIKFAILHLANWIQKDRNLEHLASNHTPDSIVGWFGPCYLDNPESLLNNENLVAVRTWATLKGDFHATGDSFEQCWINLLSTVMMQCI